MYSHESRIVDSCNKNKNRFMKDYTEKGKIKIARTDEPSKRPTFEQWIKDLKISHTVYDTDPHAREKAEVIKSRMGIKLDTRTPWQIFLGEEI